MSSDWAAGQLNFSEAVVTICLDCNGFMNSPRLLMVVAGWTVLFQSLVIPHRNEIIRVFNPPLLLIDRVVKPLASTVLVNSSDVISAFFLCRYFSVSTGTAHPKADLCLASVWSWTSSNVCFKVRANIFRKTAHVIFFFNICSKPVVIKMTPNLHIEPSFWHQSCFCWQLFPPLYRTNFTVQASRLKRLRNIIVAIRSRARTTYILQLNRGYPTGSRCVGGMKPCRRM